MEEINKMFNVVEKSLPIDVFNDCGSCSHRGCGCKYDTLKKVEYCTNENNNCDEEYCDCGKLASCVCRKCGATTLCSEHGKSEPHEATMCGSCGM